MSSGKTSLIVVSQPLANVPSLTNVANIVEVIALVLDPMCNWSWTVILSGEPCLLTPEAPIALTPCSSTIAVTIPGALRCSIATVMYSLRASVRYSLRFIFISGGQCIPMGTVLPSGHDVSACGCSGVCGCSGISGCSGVTIGPVPGILVPPPPSSATAGRYEDEEKQNY